MLLPGSLCFSLCVGVKLIRSSKEYNILKALPQRHELKFIIDNTGTIFVLKSR